ncbi:uncharacterized protein LOC122647760 [Telopea speciosissima]|uniref:uncharacterized protein LOC122647760 n=1 Tax=Telopea speciosissima TaxID=54955 RepID=UPI001CC5EBA8|nr:uncharacterized protein LOC122647760 [Telopea speciosissima]
MRMRPLEFEEGDKLFLKVAPMKGVMRFGKKGKLSPRYVGSFEILERLGPVAYKFVLSSELSNVHNVLDMSMLKRYIGDSSHILDYQPLQLNEDLSYVEEPVKILDRKDKVLRNRVVPLVKVLWRNHTSQEASWELESNMRDEYPQLFDDQGYMDVFLNFNHGIEGWKIRIQVVMREKVNDFSCF